MPSLSSLGSSPHTRGAPIASSSLSIAAGIIPAYAGSTSISLPSDRAGSDHPRIRGEHLLTVSCRSPREGSSPHTRGAHQERAGRGHQCGIIPAYAGSTTRPITTLILIPGSSPHTRGARQAATHTLALRRIIPAYAGSTVCSVTPISRPRDHPRIRGEHNANSVNWNAYYGSSPHTRGAPV